MDQVKIDMRREIILRKVKAKLIQKEVDAGLKDWFAGVGMSLIALFGGMNKADASAQDLDKYLSGVKTKVEKLDSIYSKYNKSKPGDVKFEKKFNKHYTYENMDHPKRIDIGSYNLKLGPFTLTGEYHDLDNGEIGFKSDMKVDRNASPEDIETWSDLANDINYTVKKEFTKGYDQRMVDSLKWG